MNNIVYLRIYQTPEDSIYTHHDLFRTGQLSGMIGHGEKNHPLKPESIVMVVSKSSDRNDLDSINLALVKTKDEVKFNPWKSYGNFTCYDVEFIHSKNITYTCDDKCAIGTIYDIARSVGNGHQNSTKTRELSHYMFLDKTVCKLVGEG